MKKILITFLVLLFVSASFAQIVNISGNITSNRTLTNNSIYKLSGFVRVAENATLTIEPGTIIVGENSSQGTLIINKGGKLVAKGTSAQPIIFTSEFALSGSGRTPASGDWGGIIILGNARINVAGGTAAIEGPGDTYGGNNNEDSSGVLEYVRIEYPGIAFSLNNEINGLTFGGVGSKTVVNHVQVSYSGDDSFEFFGGTVNAKNLIAYRGYDDDFDTDFGYSGKLQFLVSLRDPAVADQAGASNGFESDNDGNGSYASPYTSPKWYNVSLFGPKATDTSTTGFNSKYGRGLHLRKNSRNDVNNTLVYAWPKGITLDGTGTIGAADSNLMSLKGIIIVGSGSRTIDTTASKNYNFNVNNWFATNGWNNTSMTIAEAKAGNISLTNPQLLPANDSPLLTNGITPPNDGFFDATANYVGAFGTTDWTSGWANFNPGNYILSASDDNTVISDFTLDQNYPNPFNPSTRINFTIAKSGYAKLAVYNMLGEEVAVLVNGIINSGTHNINFNASNLSSGIYIYKLESNNMTLTKKMALLK